MSFQEAVRTVLTKKYATFSGRARRSEYWWFYLFTVLLDGVLNVIDRAIGSPILAGIASLALIVPVLALLVRRLHDTDRSAWWLLLLIVIVIGWIVLLVFVILDGTPGDNKYGPSPKNGPSNGFGGFDPNANPNPNWGQS